MRSPNGKDLEKMVKELGAKNEDELQENLLKDWDKVKCCVCGKEVSLMVAVSIHGDPAHPWCG